mmetsp:Transcript_22695/g.52679  ORF Transcript_22695/g.52679 Transcript_22695/m.52679 type:complete len:108 (+) Transcript_22695:363-686(+)
MGYKFKLCLNQVTSTIPTDIGPYTKAEGRRTVEKGPAYGRDDEHFRRQATMDAPTGGSTRTCTRRMASQAEVEAARAAVADAAAPPAPPASPASPVSTAAAAGLGQW